MIHNTSPQRFTISRIQDGQERNMIHIRDERTGETMDWPDYYGVERFVEAWMAERNPQVKVKTLQTTGEVQVTFPSWAALARWLGFKR